MGIRILSPEQVVEVKQEMWNGEFVYNLAERYGVSVAMMTNIRSGARWGEIPWPDGTKDAMPPARAKLIDRARREAQRHCAPLLPPIMNRMAAEEKTRKLNRARFAKHTPRPKSTATGEGSND